MHCLAAINLQNLTAINLHFLIAVDSPWGMRYTLVKASVGVGIVGEQYAVLTRGTLENPVAGTIDAPYLYEGMEIRVN